MAERLMDLSRRPQTALVNPLWFAMGSKESYQEEVKELEKMELQFLWDEDYFENGLLTTRPFGVVEEEVEPQPQNDNDEAEEEDDDDDDESYSEDEEDDDHDPSVERAGDQSQGDSDSEDEEDPIGRNLREAYTVHMTSLVGEPSTLEMISGHGHGDGQSEGTSEQEVSLERLGLTTPTTPGRFRAMSAARVASGNPAATGGPTPRNLSLQLAALAFFENLSSSEEDQPIQPLTLSDLSNDSESQEDL